MTDRKAEWYLEKNAELTKALLKIKKICSNYEYSDIALGKIVGIIEKLDFESGYSEITQDVD